MKKNNHKTDKKEDGFKVVATVEIKQPKIDPYHGITLIKQVGNKFIFTPVKLKTRPTTA